MPSQDATDAIVVAEAPPAVYVPLHHHCPPIRRHAIPLCALTGIFGLGVLNMVVNELDGEFDESGGYAWSALWLGAAAIGFQAM